MLIVWELEERNSGRITDAVPEFYDLTTLEKRDDAERASGAVDIITIIGLKNT